MWFLSPYRGLQRPIEELEIFLSMSLPEEGGLAHLQIKVGGKIAIRVRSPQRHETCQKEQNWTTNPVIHSLIVWLLHLHDVVLECLLMW